MSEKKINNTLSEKIKEKAGHKIPADFDFSSIGKIDLHEAEKIANEEIIFLSEDDLIDGLEDFELIPVKDLEKKVTARAESIKQIVIPETKDIELPPDEEVFSEDVLFEDFTSDQPDIQETMVETPANEEDVKSDKAGIIQEAEPASEVDKPEEPGSESVQPEREVIDETEEFMIADDTDVIELDLDEMMAVKEFRDEVKDESEILKQRIDEQDFDSRFDDIIKSEKADEDYEFIPGIYDEHGIGSNIKFIDDSHVEKKSRDYIPVFESDPLTENLVRMVEVSDGKLLLMDEVAGSQERIEYILDDSRTYDAESLALLFKEERFMDDTDFDFIDNAIVRDDYTVYIQEIDEYLRSREALSGSEVYEILGLLPEEIEDIDEKLFGDYYKNFDEEYELEFISSDLSFFDRGFVKKKNLSYFINDEFSFFEDEKRSIEDDITSESAIIFEEDIEDIKNLLDNSGFKTNRDASGEEIPEILEIREIIEPDEVIVPTELRGDDLLEVIDITDRIIILEDKNEIERIASEFPEKHEDLAKLLSYLDGLLEKLPEEVIRKFAESEYFELYSKVLKEIGK